MQLVLDTNGLAIKKRNHCFWVVAKQGSRIISPHRVTSIAVTADCLLSSAALELAAKHEIPVFFFDSRAKLIAQVSGPGYGRSASIRRLQILFAESSQASTWAIDLFGEKLQEQQACLSQLGRKLPAQKARIGEAMDKMRIQAQGFSALEQQPISDIRQQLMGIEGQIAALYWPALSACLPKAFQFKRRSRRPAEDPFNAMLNYGYGMLYSLVSQAILAAGLDPQLGIIHADQDNKPTFTYDFIEPFRPWVDRWLVNEILTRKLGLSIAEPTKTGYLLGKTGKRIFIPAFLNYWEELAVYEGKRMKRKNHIYRKAGMFAQFLQSNET